MFKPRGPQQPSFKQTGISQFQLVKFLEDAQKRLELEGEKESAFHIEMIAEYFKQDYEPGKPLKFNGRVLGL